MPLYVIIFFLVRSTLLMLCRAVAGRDTARSRKKKSLFGYHSFSTVFCRTLPNYNVCSHLEHGVDRDTAKNHIQIYQRTPDLYLLHLVITNLALTTCPLTSYCCRVNLGATGNPLPHKLPPVPLKILEGIYGTFSWYMQYRSGEIYHC
ncbi:hypothetical protein BGX38DRAFT_1148920 [Terfezia claveryi]|nr:hypothetical protein BGX38DRAFT_1148920 [Terfezia claveryi]